MSRKSSKYILILIMIVYIFITSCSKGISDNQTSNTPKEQNTNQILKDMEYLCSDECGGRQSGTEGNIKAADYISNRFKEMALGPLSSDYQIPYKKQTESINKINLELIDTGKTVHTFVYGKDYVEISLDDIDIVLPLYNEPVITDCIVLIDNIKKVKEFKNNSHTKMIIVKAQGKYAKSSDFYFKGDIPQIKVTEEAFKILQSNIGKTLQFNSDIDVQEREHNNIVSVIEGENHDSALLISAHFDHIGSIGNPDSKDYVIWRGALDNASGVSLMLETAGYLKDIYKDRKPPYDIIFCAFNEEEKISTEFGSSYFLEYIKRKYSSVFDINLDCLGNNDSSTLFMQVNETANSKEASKKIIDNLRSQNINVEFYNGDFMSDHKTFPYAVCITTIPDLSKSYIHSLEDTPDKINTSFLSEIARKLANCIGDTINAIGMDKMKLEEKSDNIESITSEGTDKMAPSDFEEKFNCKLDFLDSSQPYINIRTISRIGLFETANPIKPKPAPKDISDIRHITFIMTPCMVSFTTYKTGSVQEMETYKGEHEINESDDKSKAQQISIAKYNYYVFTRRDNSKSLLVEFSGKDILIKVSIVSHNIDKFTTFEQYQDFFEKNGLEKLIDGMVKLLQERG